MQKLNLLVAVVACGVLLAAPFARGATSSVVISQVYGGGGNSGATYTNDFVELFNRSSSAVDVSGWTVQYASSSSTSWQTTALQGAIAPGHRYLVQLGSTAAIGAALPTPDATDTTNLAASGGKVALVRDTTALSCGATAGSCASAALLEDFIGYGSASDFEGASAAPALSSTTAAVRADSGCTDTNANGADFDTATPSPRNSASAATACSGSQSPGTATAAAGVAADVQPVLSISLEKPSISFGNVFAGQTPAAVSEHVTVVDTNPAGYALTVHRTAFTPADLPLGIAASAGTALTAIPIAPLADLLLGTKTAATPPAGDIWATSVGFTTALPPVSAGHYTATVTFTVVGA
ncbi:MAG TPA: lamin tail domain-containing protein [Gaiellaceae bacterium]|nr:lamin tail domain-containing protein [Gaiellaceae bacterium]